MKEMIVCENWVFLVNNTMTTDCLPMTIDRTNVNFEKKKMTINCRGS